jgi:hypothetical protein
LGWNYELKPKESSWYHLTVPDGSFDDKTSRFKLFMVAASFVEYAIIAM